jgi:hypothetical protein
MDDEYMSIRDIGIELDKIDARVDELQVLADKTAVEIEELTNRLKFYEIVIKDWMNEDENNV